MNGDLDLSKFEDELSTQWPSCLDGNARSFRVISAFWRLLQRGIRMTNAAVVLVDLGPNLGAINRSALIAADYVVVPLSPDLFSLQGLKNLGPTLERWRQQWQERTSRNQAAGLDLPPGQMQPVGYVILQHVVRLDRPVKAFGRWMEQIPEVYHQVVLGEQDYCNQSVNEDPECLALLKNYQSLMPLAQEARKPIFHLKPADGALGAHATAAQRAYQDFEQLAQRIAGAVGLTLGG